jgi:hypothetical protein
MKRPRGRLLRCVLPLACRGACAAASLLAGAAWGAGAEAPRVEGRLPEAGWNVFGDRDAVIPCILLSGGESLRGQLAWSLSVSGRVVQRGAAAVAVSKTAPATVAMTLRIPPVAEEVVVEAELAAALVLEHEARAAWSVRKPLRVFPDNPFAGRRRWLEGLKIHLFDPEKKTAAMFEAAGIPFTPVRDPDALAGLTDGIAIVGEGVSLRDYRGLAGCLCRAAAAGRPAICLAPREGAIEIAGTGGHDGPRPRSLALHGDDVIRDLDKRLDAATWAARDGAAGTGLNLAGDRGAVVGEIRADGAWRWMEMRFGSGGGTAIVCGFAIVGLWDSGPAPRYLLRRILERAAGAGRE